jgi:hypothetical protein
VLLVFATNAFYQRNAEFHKSIARKPASIRSFKTADLLR